MLMFAIESVGARLAALGRLPGGVPDSIVDSLPDPGQQQTLVELIVVRNVIAHNHIWKFTVDFDADWEQVALEASEHLHGDETRRYAAAVDARGDRTKSLGLHLIPTAIRRTDVLKALPVVVRTLDHLATLDVPDMGSLADHRIRVAAGMPRLREVGPVVAVPPALEPQPTWAWTPSDC
jgi:hypothetical protein